MMNVLEANVPLAPRPALRARGVVLLAARDDGLVRRSETALHASGFETLTAHSPCVAEYVLDRHSDIDVVVIDGAILGPVSFERPGPLLVKSPHVPIVVANAAALDNYRRRVVRAYRAECVDSEWDLEGLTRKVGRLTRQAHSMGAAPIGSTSPAPALDS